MQNIEVIIKNNLNFLVTKNIETKTLNNLNLLWKILKQKF